MKKVLVLLSLLLFVVVGFAQLPDMRTNLRYNTAACRYEVYVRPATSAPSFFLGPSQITIAVPHNTITNYVGQRSNAFVINTITPLGSSWSINNAADKSSFPAYANGHDYYVVDHGGGPLGAVTANVEVLLFSFTLGHNCIDGLRLWEGLGVANGGLGAIPNAYNDPKYPTQPYGGGGDYETNINEGMMDQEKWVGNYNNTTTVLPKPTADITYACQPGNTLATITANVIGGSACSSIQYTWSGPGIWLLNPGTNYQGVGQTPFGTYQVDLLDNNGCPASATLILNAQCSAVPLPVELLSFTVTKTGDDALLEWATATEINNNYFDIQHSTDGEEFVNVGREYSLNGNSTNLQNYKFTHMKPGKGINYYRLKQVDYDGSFEYSDIRSVVFGGLGNLTIYPNPTTKVLNVQVPQDMDLASVIEIVSPAGQIVRSFTNADLAKSVLSFDVSDLAVGFYFIQIRTSVDLYREQFVITK